MKNLILEREITFFLGSLDRGGAQTVMLNLLSEFMRNGVRVTLLLTSNAGALSSSVPDNVQVIVLKKHTAFNTLICLLKLPVTDLFRTAKLMMCESPSLFKRLPSLVKYLESSQPKNFMSTLDVLNIMALISKRIANVNTSMYVRQTTFHSRYIDQSSKYFDKYLLPELMRRWYHTADRVIALTESMKKDLVDNVGITEYSILTINNPIDIGKVKELSLENLEDDWFNDGNVPIVLAVGRLDVLKGYSSLIDSIKLVNQVQEVRLVILGEGIARRSLEIQIDKLMLKEVVMLPGEVKNPYKYMVKSDVFVLSSLCEGFPNVLLEALACGCNIVSTDCDSGPRDILVSGKYGRLVPVGDVKSLAKEITNALENPMSKKDAINKAYTYNLRKIAKEYLDVAC
ncbi:MAG: glycosyltransferase [Gammaproteobacteria bacterium]|nr:glycosyltransferase [Gammaproteobacteria bacterium]